MKKIIAVILTVAFVLALASCSKGNNTAAEENKKIVLCLDYTPNTNHSGIFAAKVLMLKSSSPKRGPQPNSAPRGRFSLQ